MTLARIVCKLKGHEWANDTQWPVHGYDDMPHLDSYCERCGVTGNKYLKVKA